jgi:transposase
LKQCNRVGVDVSAKELVVAIEASGRREVPIVFANDAEGHRKLVKLATKRGASAQVVLESTGTYGLDLTLHRAKRVEVMVANPRAIAHFARASLQRSKTDRLDAGTILEFAMRLPFEPWSPPLLTFWSYGPSRGGPRRCRRPWFRRRTACMRTTRARSSAIS